jgi:thiamine transport system permease protein
MNHKAIKRITLSILFILLLPYALLLAFGFKLSRVPMHELLNVLINSCLQATASSVFIVVFAVFGLLGFLSLKPGLFSHLCPKIVVLPSFLPALFVATSFMSALSSYKLPLYGFWQVVAVHTIVSSGLIGNLLWVSILTSKTGLFDLAHSLNLSRPNFWFKVLLPNLRHEIFSLWAFAFSLCFTSFTVPHLLAPTQALSFDVFIFQKLRLDADLGQALSLCFFQVAFMFLFLKFLKPQSQDSAVMGRTSQSLNRYALTFAIWPLVIVSATLVLSQFVQFALALKNATQIPWLSLQPAILGTLVVGCVSFCLSLGLLSALSFSAYSEKLRGWLLTYIAPSGIVVGLLVWMLTAGENSLFWIIVSFNLIMMCTLYRMGLHSKLENLQQDIQLARSLGVSLKESYFKVVLPQTLPIIFSLSGVVAFWSVGEYTLSVVIAQSDITLSLWIKSMLKAYQFESAAILNLMILTLGFLLYLLGERLSYVANKKLN